MNYKRQASHSMQAQANQGFKTLMIAFICFAVLIVFAIPLIKAYLDSKEYQAAYEAEQAANKQAVEQNRLIQADYQRVKDPEYIEDIARRDYYYSKEGELIFILPEESQAQ